MMNEPLWTYEDGESRLPIIKVGSLNRFDADRIRTEAAGGLLPYPEIAPSASEEVA